VKGLYVKEVDPNGLAADIRPYEINAGEVVTRVNRVPVTTLADFQRVVESLKPGDAIVLNLSRFDRSSNPNRVVQRIVQFTYQ
jgi:S1-C subfamily serine protease